MNKAPLTIAVAAIAFATTTTAALAQYEGQKGPAQQGQEQQAPRMEQQSSGYTDTQLRAYAAAKVEVDRLGAQRTEAQITPILQRHRIDAATYAGIDRAAASDRTLAQRIASLTPHTRTE